MAGTPRPPYQPQAGYPAWLTRLLAWYDGLADGQRVRYAAGSILFLLACTGYLLSIGSSVLLARAQAQVAEAAALAPTSAPVVADLSPLSTPSATATTAAPGASPTVTSTPTDSAEPTPFSGIQIQEGQVVPRYIPDNSASQSAPVATAVPRKPLVVVPTPAPTVRAAPTGTARTPEAVGTQSTTGHGTPVATSPAGRTTPVATTPGTRAPTQATAVAQPTSSTVATSESVPTAARPTPVATAVPATVAPGGASTSPPVAPATNPPAAQPTSPPAAPPTRAPVAPPPAPTVAPTRAPTAKPAVVSQPTAAPTPAPHSLTGASGSNG